MRVAEKTEQSAAVKTILFATDFSAASGRAQGYATGLAARFRAQLVVMHVRPARNYALPPETWPRDDDPETNLRRLKESISNSVAGIRAESYLGEGNVWNALNSFVAQTPVDLLVLGTRGREGASKFLLGSQAEEIFRRLIAAGVRGYVFKSDPAREIEAAITALRQHKPYFTSRISSALIDSAVRAINEGQKDQPFLTPRERQIIQLVAEGFTNKQVAKALRVSEKTVETHRASLMRKLGINSIIELVRYAVRNNIIQP